MATNHDEHNGDQHVHVEDNDTVLPIDHPLDYYQVRTVALVNLLREKGILTLDELRRVVEQIEAQSPAIGSRVVARAWVDPAFKERLLEDGKAACAELEIDTDEVEKIVALENTDDVHYMVVCTLCSCYPRVLLGQPPTWYKSFPYRSKAVTDPRGAMADLGYTPPEDIEVRVVDSTADCRYLIIPRRPKGTEDWTEERLAAIVTRDSMVGVGEALTPEQLEEGKGVIVR
ncbi:MAG: nitrile hydratase subunit alpha [bacterium]